MKFSSVTILIKTLEQYINFTGCCLLFNVNFKANRSIFLYFLT